MQVTVGTNKSFLSSTAAILSNDSGAVLKEKCDWGPCGAFILLRSEFLKRKLVSEAQQAHHRVITVKWLLKARAQYERIHIVKALRCLGRHAVGVVLLTSAQRILYMVVCTNTAFNLSAYVTNVLESRCHLSPRDT